MRQKLIEKKIKRPLNDSIRQTINKKLEEAKKDMKDKGPMTYSWDKKTNTLSVQISALAGTVYFKEKKVTAYADVPFYLLPLLEPFRKQAIEILEKEIDELLC